MLIMGMNSKTLKSPLDALFGSGTFESEYNDMPSKSGLSAIRNKRHV